MLLSQAVSFNVAKSRCIFNVAKSRCIF